MKDYQKDSIYAADYSRADKEHRNFLAERRNFEPTILKALVSRCNIYAPFLVPRFDITPATTLTLCGICVLRLDSSFVDLDGKKHQLEMIPCYSELWNGDEISRKLAKDHTEDKHAKRGMRKS